MAWAGGGAAWNVEPVAWAGGVQSRALVVVEAEVDAAVAGRVRVVQAASWAAGWRRESRGRQKNFPTPRGG
jgi:hypothetical protein